MADDCPWWRPYRALIAATVGGYGALLLALAATGAFRDHWANASTAYFVAANLIVLWWYAHWTYQVAATSQQQFGFHAAQVHIANKPIVFLDHERDPAHPRSTGRIVARNVGPGIAINVYVLAHLTGDKWDCGALGAVEPGGELRIPEVIDSRFDEHAGRASGCIVAAEAIKTRTLQWIVTLNIQDHSGAIRHRLVDFVPDEELTVNQLIAKHGPRFARELAEFGSEVSRV